MSGTVVATLHTCRRDDCKIQIPGVAVSASDRIIAGLPRAVMVVEATVIGASADHRYQRSRLSTAPALP